jgi:hypothetical protein
MTISDLAGVCRRRLTHWQGLKPASLRSRQWSTRRRQPPPNLKPPLRAAGAAAAPRLGTQNPGSAGGYVVSLKRPLR